MVYWYGKAIPVNAMHGIGYRYMGRRKVPFIRVTDEYKQFVEDLAICFLAHEKLGNDIVEVRILAQLNSRKDMDGIIKPTFDAIQRAGIIDNDRQIRGLAYDCRDCKRGEPEIIGIEVRRRPDLSLGDDSPQDENPARTGG